METVTLGEHVVPVVPQRHARLRHRLSAEDFRAVMSVDYAHHAYRILGILIPAILKSPEEGGIPEWEFEGYASEEAWRAGEYVEELDKSPTSREIVEALKAAFRVNGGDDVGKIVDLVTTGQKQMNLQAQRSANSVPATPTPDSPVSAGETTVSP